MLQARFTVGGALTILTVESDDLFQCLIRAVNVFVFEIQNRVDPVFLHEEAETVLKPVPGEERTVMKRFLTINVELGCPPGLGSIFEFGPVPDEGILAGGSPENRIGRDLETSGFFHMV